MSIEAMKQALEALELWLNRKLDEDAAWEAHTALRTAIAEAEKQEPVACVIDGDLYFHHEIDWEDLAYQGHGVELLYTTPPAARLQDAQPLRGAMPWEQLYPQFGNATPPAAQRQWVGLTDDEIREIIGAWAETPIKGYTRKLFDQIEAKLKEKNNG